ncbi:TPA: hypothetical protein ACGFAU_004525 [Yersinia enterocolitica]
MRVKIIFLLFLISFLPQSSLAQSKWFYSIEKDQMTDKPIYYGFIGSDNVEKVGSLMKTAQGMYLSMKTVEGRGTALGISFSNDDDKDPVRYMCEFQLNSPCTVLVRFDDKPAVNFVIVPPESGGEGIMYIMDSDKFFNELKSAKKTLIRANIWNFGDATYSFISEGLEWNH